VCVCGGGGGSGGIKTKQELRDLYKSHDQERDITARGFTWLEAYYQNGSNKGEHQPEVRWEDDLRETNVKIPLEGLSPRRGGRA
jgi:hypothetical protein